MFRGLNDFSGVSHGLVLPPRETVVIEMLPDVAHKHFSCGDKASIHKMPRHCRFQDVPQAVSRSRSSELDKRAQLTYAASIFVRVIEQWKGPRHDV